MMCEVCGMHEAYQGHEVLPIRVMATHDFVPSDRDMATRFYVARDNRYWLVIDRWFNRQWVIGGSDYWKEYAHDEIKLMVSGEVRVPTDVWRPLTAGVTAL